MQALELFCGAGGLGLALERCGYDTFGIDADEDAVATYEQNVGEAAVHDLSDGTLPSAAPTDVEMVAGGFPCQPFSAANNHKDKLDDRATLGDSFVDIVADVTPRYAVIENVRALKTRHTDYYDHIVSRLESLDYNFESDVLDASYYGVPQARKRLFVVADRCGGPTLPEPNDEPLGTGDVLNTVPDEHEHKGGGRTSPAVWRDETQPSHTVTAQANNVVRYDGCDWRQWTTDELKQLQSFPEWFTFVGNKTSKRRQIGNAVPPKLGEAVVNSLTG